MAPTAGANKRLRPAFSPPRPGKKSKSNVTISVTRKNGVDRVKKSTATKSVNGVNGRRAGGKNGSAGASASAQKMQRQKQRRKAAAGTMRAILDEASDDDEEDEDGEDEEEGGSDSGHAEEVVSDSVLDEEEDEEEDTNTRGSIRSHDNTETQASSPEPEFMLAEVIHHDRGKQSTSKSTNPSDSGFPVPLPLIHHIMQAQFATPEKTSLSKDALSLLGKYVGAFVREGIHRCALDRAEREKAGGGTGDVADSGWLEVEDLERVGVQLCLDF